VARSIVVRSVKKRMRARRLRSYDKADRRFAIASLILLAFLLVTGVVSWLAGDNPSVAAQNSAIARAPR
jgi:hypothetical protein